MGETSRGAGGAARRRTRAPGRVLVGTSGWTYAHWRGAFYPPGLPRSRELPYLASLLQSVEVNGTFYSLTRPSACEGWRAAVPPDFVFALKGSRYITHMLKLKNFREPLANFFASGILRLGKQIGPFLWQLPPMLGFDEARAAAFFAALPRTIADAEAWARAHDARLEGRAALEAPDGRRARLRHALEIRHDSWLCDASLRLLEREGIALVASDTAGRYALSFATTADFAYVRLHGSTQLYASRYEDDEIAAWAARIRGWRDEGRDVFVYFDNDAKVHAPGDAIRLRAALEGTGAAARTTAAAAAAP